MFKLDTTQKEEVIDTSLSVSSMFFVTLVWVVCRSPTTQMHHLNRECVPVYTSNYTSTSTCGWFLLLRRLFIQGQCHFRHVLVSFKFNLVIWFLVEFSYTGIITFYCYLQPIHGATTTRRPPAMMTTTGMHGHSSTRMPHGHHSSMMPNHMSTGMHHHMQQSPHESFYFSYDPKTVSTGILE